MLKRLLTLFIVLFLFETSTLQGQTLPQCGICAHRGENGVFPENTVIGLQEAVRLGARQVEFDVKRTKDGRLILMHDATVDRTTDGKGKVSDLTFAQIRALDAGIKKGDRFAKTKVPTFEEALDCLPSNIWINVHTNVSNPTEIAKILIEKKREQQAFVACGRNTALAIKKNHPQILICNMERRGSDVSRYIRETVDWKCEFIQLLQLGSPEEMEVLKKAGVRINYFSARDAKHFRTLVENGVDFPLVDKTGDFLEIAKELDMVDQK